MAGINFIKKNRIFILISLAAIFVAFLPLFTVNCINGHDLEYHLLRIEALKEGILAGHPFLKVNMLYFGGRGYASSMFYPDFLLYIPAILRCMGGSINFSYHFFVGFCILMSFLSMYISVKLIWSDAAASFNNQQDGSDSAADYAGIIAAICYTLAQYHIDDIYTRAAVGEFTAMIFLPFLIYGLYDMSVGGLKRPALMAAGFAGCLLCHTITTVFVIGLYALCVIFNFNKIIKNKKTIVTLILTAIGVALVTAFYWLPVIEQLTGAVFQTGSGGFDLDYEKLLWRDVFINRNKSLGLALPLLCLFRLMSFSEIKKDDALKSVLKLSDFCLMAGVLYTAASTGLLPWGRLKRILSFVQFPWRLFIVSTALLSAAAGCIIVLGIKNYLKKTDNRACTDILNAGMIIVGIVMMISAVMNLSRNDLGYYSYSDDYYSHVPFTGHVIGGEWLPESVTDRGSLTKDCDIAVTSNGERVEVERTENTLKVPHVSRADEYVDVPFIYYKGYAARDDKQNELLVDGSGINGSVRVYTGGKDTDGIFVYYKGTLLQKNSAVISLISFLAICLLFTGAKKSGKN